MRTEIEKNVHIENKNETNDSKRVKAVLSKKNEIK